MRTKILFSLFILAFAVSSCSDDSTSGGADTSTNPGFFSAQINGSSWKAQASSFVVTFDKDEQAGDLLEIRGTALDGSQLIISTNGLDPKKYVFDPDNSTFDGLITYMYKVDGKTETPFMQYAEISITTHDAAAKTFSGNFKFNTLNDEHVGINGSFAQMVYKEI